MKSLNGVIGPPLSVISQLLTTHCWKLKLGSISDIYTANRLLNGYAKCGEINYAHRRFDEMSHRDTVSWNTIISGYVNSGNLDAAWEVLKCMKRDGFEFDEYTFGSILKGVANANRLDFGQQVHSMVVKMGQAGNVYSGSALLDMYAKCNRVEDAFVAFQTIPERNTVSWNALITGFAQVGDRENAFWLLECMENENVEIDDGTFASLLPLLDDPEFYKLTMQVHGKVIKHGLEFDKTVCNATIASYSECGSLDDAERVFDGSSRTRDLVTWNSMLAAYLLHKKQDLALKLLIGMEENGFQPDIYSYTSVISVCFEENHNDHGKSLHGVVIKRGLEKSVPISNALISMYLKSDKGSMEEAMKIFGSLELKDRVSWNSILTGFSQSGQSEDAVKLFRQMRYSTIETDQYAFSAILKSCSDMATVQLGEQIHALALELGLESNEFVSSSLMFMYSKCGIIEDARKLFEETSQEKAITWNSIIFGYAQHGQGNIALDLFNSMREKRVRLDHITFVAVLTACSHIGLVDQGSKLLKCMESDFGIRPRMEHYACGVDLYGRAGRLEEAKALIEEMPFKPNAMLWTTLLGACRSCGNIELARQVAAHLLELQPKEHCTYVLLSDLYGNLNKWNEKAKIKRLMKERRVKKVPGWSWIEVKNEVHAFNAEDRSHSCYEEINVLLQGLMEEIRRIKQVEFCCY